MIRPSQQTHEKQMQELEQAARLALEALEDAHYKIEHLQDIDKRKIAMKALQDALKKSKQTKDKRTTK